MVNFLQRHKKIATFIAIASGVALFCACALAVFPFPKSVLKGSAFYGIVWEDGVRREESYCAALGALSGFENGRLLFEREGVRGSKPAGGELFRLDALLDGGSLPELLAADFSALSGLEGAALYRKYANVGFYSGDLFAYDGERVSRTRRTAFGEIVLLDGKLQSGVLVRSGAKKLTLRPQAEFSAAALVGTQVCEIAAREPYFTEGGALYLKTPGGVRLIAALPSAEELAVSEVAFCDEGALSPCARLVSLSLPFIGLSRADGGRVASLFGEVPASLARVFVSGGKVGEFAFSGCPFVREIDLCGIPAQDVSMQAFIGCERLQKLHTLREDLSLGGNFTQKRLPCGCLLYEREEKI